MANEVEDIYGTGFGASFAEEMAKALLKRGAVTKITGDQAFVPGAWMQNVPDILQVLQGSQYRDLGLSQRKEQAERTLDPNFKSGVNRYGAWAKQPRAMAPGRANAPITTGSVDLNKSVEKGATLDDFVNKLIQVESGGNPSARTGSYRGLGQFSPALEKQYGIDDTNRNNPEVQKNAIRKHTQANYEYLTKTLGRQPTYGELYLAHQQGAGGAAAHLLRPDQPAWLNMHSTDEGQQKGPDWAKRAILGNIPNSHPLKSKMLDEITSGDFANLWTSKFADLDKNIKTVQADGLSTPSMLGGPKEGEFQVAQAPYTATPSEPNIESGMTANTGGYTGMVPPANPLESTQQLRARLLKADSTEEQNKIIEDYMKRAQGTTYDTTTGKLTVTPAPGGQKPTITHIPNKPFSLGLEGLSLQIIPNSDGGFTAVTPTGQQHQFRNLEDMMRWAQRIGAEGRATGELTQASTQQVNDAKDRALNSIPVLQTLTEMEAISKAGRWLPRGPTSDFMSKARQLLDNFGLPVPPGTPDAEVLQKLNSLLASESTKAISQSRGTNFELQTFMRMNPGLLTTQAGTELLIQILKKEAQQKLDIGRMASKIREGKDVAGFQDKVEQYYKDHPITIDMPDGRKLSTQRITTPSEAREKLRSGTYFIMPNGELGRVP